MMSRQPAASRGRALIDIGRQVGIQMDDLLTVDGEEIAWGAVKDFNAPINGVLVSFHKGEPIRDRHLINALRGGRCPVASLESELSQRITLAQLATARSEVLTLKPNFHGIGIDLKEAGRRIRSWWRAGS
jgi:hypothetical protein